MATRLVNKRAQFQDVFKNVLVYTDDAYNPGNAATGSGTFASSDVTVTGAALGDVVLASFTVDTVDAAIVAAVTAANTVTVTVLNNTAGAVDLAAGKLRLYVLQPNDQLSL